MVERSRHFAIRAHREISAREGIKQLYRFDDSPLIGEILRLIRHYQNDVAVLTDVFSSHLSQSFMDNTHSEDYLTPSELGEILDFCLKNDFYYPAAQMIATWLPKVEKNAVRLGELFPARQTVTPLEQGAKRNLAQMARNRLSGFLARVAEGGRVDDPKITIGPPDLILLGRYGNLTDLQLIERLKEPDVLSLAVGFRQSPGSFGDHYYAIWERTIDEAVRRIRGAP
jgi:hypothetical protein